MHALLPLLFFLAPPFWDVRPPEQWSDAEIQEIRTRSPWAQSLTMGTPVTAFLATALPVEHAEAELRLRTKKNPHPLPEPDPDYVDYLREHRDEALVLAGWRPAMTTFGAPPPPPRALPGDARAGARRTRPAARGAAGALPALAP